MKTLRREVASAVMVSAMGRSQKSGKCPILSAGAEREAIDPLSRCLIHRASELPTFFEISIRAGNSEDEG